MVIFRENTEDIYAGIEYAGGTADSQKVLDFLAKEFPKEFGKIRFGTKAKTDEWNKQLEAIGVPSATCPCRSASASSPSATSAPSGSCTARSATRSKEGRKSVTLVHKGNIMKFTEGAFRDWGYQVAKDFYGAEDFDGGPWQVIKRRQGPGAQARHHHQGRDRRRDPPADSHPPGRLRRHRHAEPQRRLHLRRPGGLRRRHRHRPRRQHQLRHRPRDLRGHPRHGAQVRRPGQGEPRQRDPLAAR